MTQGKKCHRILHENITHTLFKIGNISKKIMKAFKKGKKVPHTHKHVFTNRKFDAKNSDSDLYIT